MVGSGMARERLFALRETIARLEGKTTPDLSEKPLHNRGEEEVTHHLSLGIDAFDEALGGGVPLQGLSEIRCRLLADAGAASGFATALATRIQAEEKERSDQPYQPVLWIGDTVGTMEAGLPHAIGLVHFGLARRGFFHAAPRKLDDALWLAESAMQSGAFCAVIFEVRGNPTHFGLTESRRLNLRAKMAGKPLLVLREGGEEEASSAACRFLAEPAPARPRALPDGSPLEGSIGNPVFRLTLEKSRSPAPFSLLLEWNSHDRRFVSLKQPQRLPDETFAHSGARLSASADRPDRTRQMGSVLAFDRAS
jgi:protein ImuA